MKYLKIHILLWAIFCGIFLLLDMIYYVICASLRFLWEFKFERWEDYNRCDYQRSVFGKTYVDKTPLDTFKRYFNSVLNG